MNQQANHETDDETNGENFDVAILGEFPHYAITTDGKIWSIRGRKFLRQCMRGGKLCVHLQCTYGMSYIPANYNKVLPVHRLVALAFIPNPENFPCVDHIDQNEFNNNSYNLRWCNHKTNMNNRKDNKNAYERRIEIDEQHFLLNFNV